VDIRPNLPKSASARQSSRRRSWEPPAPVTASVTADETTVAQGKTEKEMAHQNLPKYLAVITYTFRAA